MSPADGADLLTHHERNNPMSAYVCDDTTINRIVSGLTNAKDFGDFNTPTPKPAEKLAEFIGDPRDFGRTLYSMNVNAVEQRYPDCVGNPDRLPGQCNDDGSHLPYSYRSAVPPRPIQLYKSLQCFLYQCSEGDVDELPLYKLLREYTKDLAVHMIENSADYEKSDWG